MINKILQKFWFPIVVFSMYVVIMFVLRLNDRSPLPYINIVIYFFILLVIKENISKSHLNKNIVQHFYYLFLYLALFTSFPIVFRPVESWNFIVYVYFEVLLKLFILSISISIALASFSNLIQKDSHKWVVSILLGAVVVLINFFPFLKNPLILDTGTHWPIWQVRNYVTMVLSIFALLIFWFRYYQKYFVVSEYLNLVIFLFTLSNVIEALHFVAYQHQLRVFINGQIISFVLNILLLTVWYFRLLYLNTDISKENERYLKNFKYLNGLVSKPKPSFFEKIIPFISIHLIAGILILGVSLIIALYLINKITFYLLLNTAFILITVILALFFSFSSIRRDWQNAVGILFRNTKRK